MELVNDILDMSKLESEEVKLDHRSFCLPELLEKLNMGGWETTRQIRSLDREDAKRIPIIAMSANAFQEDIEHSVKSGMNAHITKPLNMDEVIKTIVKSETVR